MSGRLLVNLGCGSVFHPDWINLDCTPASAVVRRWDIRKPLPFAAGQIDVCYASHVLEHLTKENAASFLADCYRVLKPGGIIRLVVPDLENIASAYLRSLQEVSRRGQHQWMTIELVDQMVRREGGGEMHRALLKADHESRKFIVERIGLEAEAAFERTRKSSRVSFANLGHYLRRAREEFAGALAGLVLGQEGKAALKEGLFRRSGQVHLWMYDRLSLESLLVSVGFAEATVCRADESRLSQFSTFNLDTLNGRVRKPDSLFMEAVRP